MSNPFSTPIYAYDAATTAKAADATYSDQQNGAGVGQITQDVGNTISAGSQLVSDVTAGAIGNNGVAVGALTAATGNLQAANQAAQDLYADEYSPQQQLDPGAYQQQMATNTANLRNAEGDLLLTAVSR